MPTVKFGPNRKGLPCLSMTFDKSLSQHAFALAVDNSGKKAAAVVMDAVRNEFGAMRLLHLLRSRRMASESNPSNV